MVRSQKLQLSCPEGVAAGRVQHCLRLLLRVLRVLRGRVWWWLLLLLRVQSLNGSVA